MNSQPTIEQCVTFLGTADLSATDHFYRTLLSLPLILDQGVCRIYRATGDAFLGFCTHLAVSKRPTDVILTLVSTDIDGWHRYLTDQQVTIEKPPTYNKRFNITHLFLRDPNGYLVEIQRFHDAAWPAPNS